MASKQCKGKKNLNSQCKKSVIEGEDYCETHLYFKTYTEHMMKNLQKCSRCANMFYYESLKQCPPCTNHSRLQSKEVSEERKKNIKCEGITKKGTKCTYNQMPNSKYCCDHQYMNNYTSDMLKNLRQCTGCSSYRYFTTHSTCDECRGYRRDKKLENKLHRVDTPKCKVINCTRNSKFGNYCGKHKRLQLCEDAEKDGFKICGDGNHNCTNRIPLDSKHTYCNDCLQKHRDKDKKQYQKEKHSVEEFNSEHADMMKCIKCGKEFSVDDCAKDTHENISKKCKDCFKKQQDIEKHRPKRDRDETEEMKRNPQRKITKDKWKKEHIDKCKNYWQKSRQKKRDRLGEIEYKLQASEQAQKYRDLNPEKMKEQYEKTRKNPHHRYVFYKRRARGDGIKTKIPFELTEVECKKYYTNACHYCGRRYDGEVLNGIDRVDNTKGYMNENCVTCCTMCNMMKRVLSHEKFLNICEHILGYTRIIRDCEMHPVAFKDYKSSKYVETKHQATKRRGIAFELDEEQFDIIKSMPCYLCGKICSEKHNNGIDRIDSKGKYCMENCKACCGNCNYLKKTYVLHEFLTRLIKIVCYSKLKNTPEEIQDATEYNTRCDSDALKILNESEYIIEQLSMPYEELICEKMIIKESENIDDITKSEIMSTQDKQVHRKYESTVRKAKTPDELKEYNRIKKQESDARKREEYGTEVVKKTERLKKASQRKTNVNEEGYVIKTKIPATSTERSAKCRSAKILKEQLKKQTDASDQEALNTIKELQSICSHK